MSRTSPQIFFETIKELRDGYFVEYTPPGGEKRFATLSLVFHKGTTRNRARTKVEEEARQWLERYPIPLMVFASDERGDPVELSDSFDRNHLMGWRRPTGELEMRWELVRDADLPDDALSIERLLDVYRDINYRRKQEVHEEADAKARQRRLGFAIIFLWAVVVPVTIALLGFASVIVGICALIYALYKAARQGALMLGWLEPTEREKAEREKERRMRHYYYHCERNPDGFRRLLAENFEQDEREQIRKEAEELGASSVQKS